MKLFARSRLSFLSRGAPRRARLSAHFHVEAATKRTSRSWDTSTPCHVPEAAPCAKHVCALYAL